MIHRNPARALRPLFAFRPRHLQRAALFVAALSAGLCLAGGARAQIATLADSDRDGIYDFADNCPFVSNPVATRLGGQADANGDGIGDACQCGDFSGDGYVDSVDARLAQRCAVGAIPCAELCDVTGDGACDSVDARLIQRAAVGAIDASALTCPQRQPRVREEWDEPIDENPPLDPDSFPFPLTPDDPNEFGPGDLEADPNADSKWAALGATLGDGRAMSLVPTPAPTVSVIRVIEKAERNIVEVDGLRVAEIDLGVGDVFRVIGANTGDLTIRNPDPTPTRRVHELRATDYALEDLEVIKTYEIHHDGVTATQIDLVSVGVETTGGGTNPFVGGIDDIKSNFEPTTCEELAVFAFGQLGPIRPDMPPVRFPNVIGCNKDRCIDALQAWLSSHHNAWRATQMFDWMDAQSSYYRSYVWTRPGLDEHGNPATIKTAPEYWWGDFAQYRYDAIDQGIDKLWDMLETGETGDIELRLQCPDAGNNPGNVCFTSDASAHHWVKGWVNLCDEFFDWSDWGKARIIVHELMHHRGVSFKKNGTWRFKAIQDVHTHGHGNSCAANIETNKGYGEDAVRHMATYTNLQQGHCWHRDKNFQNNDTYAYFVTTVGEAVHRLEMWNWPQPAPPTPKPPQCDDPGTEGCECQDTFPFGDGSDPDGDYRIDKFCPDNGAEISCMETKFNASDIVGICTSCEEIRGPGCECDLSNPCDEGSCFGDDTFGGGVGHCYKDPPPEFACLADCKRLYNDDQAWCYHDDPIEARCYDSLCEPWDVEGCYAEGKVCRYGECVTECVTNQDCAELGYPGNFVCGPSLRCEYMF